MFLTLRFYFSWYEKSGKLWLALSPGDVKYLVLFIQFNQSINKNSWSYLYSYQLTNIRYCKEARYYADQDSDSNHNKAGYKSNTLYNKKDYH